MGCLIAYIYMGISDFQLHSIFTSCQDKFGVQLCVEGQVPDIASLRLQEIPVLSAIGQTEVRVSMGASTDKTTTIDWTNNIVKNNHETGERKKQICRILRF